jgi:hypothetical protein
VVLESTEEVACHYFGTVSWKSVLRLEVLISQQQLLLKNKFTNMIEKRIAIKKVRMR